MKLGVILAGLVGLALVVGLVAYFGAGHVLHGVEAIGWRGFLLFVLCQVATFLPLGAAWYGLALGQPLRHMAGFVWGRAVREGAADVLPFSPIGGLVAGARAVLLNGVAPATAYASLAVDLVAEIVAQLVFVLVGVILLLGRVSRVSLAHDPLILIVFLGLALMVTGAAAFILAQRRGLQVVDRLIVRLLPSAAIQVQGTQREIALIYTHPGRLALSTALHVVAWVAAAFGSWIALRFMGVALPFLAVLAIESLVSAMKSAAFMVPNAAGVQEGGFAIVGVLFGMAPETAIALSLLRRARDIAIGVPTLLVWQLTEGRRLLRRSSLKATSALDGGSGHALPQEPTL